MPKSTFLPLWIWCEINLNLVTNRHTIWKLTEFLRGENGFWSRQRAQQFLLCPWVGKNTILHQKVTISHQISRTKLLRFRTKFHYDFAPKNYDFAPNLPDQIIMISHQIYYDFAPNLLRFRTKFLLRTLTISHQIYYDFAPNSLRFRTKFIKMSQHTFTLTSYDFAPN